MQVDRGGEELSFSGKVASVKFDDTEEATRTGNCNDVYVIK